MTETLGMALPTHRDSAALTFDQVTKRFTDGTVALDDVSLSIAPGELVSVVGPSGCGKSTLLRLGAGLTAASAGEVRSVAAEDIAVVFQDPTLLPWRSVTANVELLGELHGLSREERRQRAKAAIHLVGLDGFEQHRPRTLSGGMRMRVSLARALTLRPRLFLFDEPFAALDEITRQRLNGELLTLFNDQQFAGLFVTHSVTEAVFVGTRVVVLSTRPGRIVSEILVPFGPPRDPELRFSAPFASVAGEVASALRESSS